MRRLVSVFIRYMAIRPLSDVCIYMETCKYTFFLSFRCFSLIFLLHISLTRSINYNTSGNWNLIYSVVSGSRDTTLRVWDIESGECLHILVGHLAAVRCVQYDGRLVVSGAYDFTVKVWDPQTETCLHTLSGHTNRVYSLQVNLA